MVNLELFRKSSDLMLHLHPGVFDVDPRLVKNSADVSLIAVALSP